MQNVAWYQGDALKRLVQGAAVGVAATVAIGFGWGGWMLGSSAKTLAESTASSAVVAAIAPIWCRPVPTQRRRRNEPDSAEKEPTPAAGGLCRKRRLGRDAWQPAADFRRAPGMRRSAQQPEIGSLGDAEHDDRRSSRCSRLNARSSGRPVRDIRDAVSPRSCSAPHQSVCGFRRALGAARARRSSSTARALHNLAGKALSRHGKSDEETFRLPFPRDVSPKLARHGGANKKIAEPFIANRWSDRRAPAL